MNEAEKESRSRIRVRERLCVETRPEPCGLVIFGASGDLAARKLLPALLSLQKGKLLPQGFYALGIARSSLSDEAFRSRAPGLNALYYLSGSYDDPATYASLKSKLEELDRKFGSAGNVVYYLAVPPALYPVIPRRLAEAGLLEGVGGKGRSRVVVEKPFGRDLESARSLSGEIGKFLREEQIYRIDHYLGKETVQNIMMFRFANSIFEPVWNREHVDHIQISVLESLGVESRAGYYDSSGVLRDMFQNHMTQLLALTAMEPPSGFGADAIRNEKAKVFQSLLPLDKRARAEHVVLGQYAGYAREPGVAEGSRTPTYAAMRLEIDNWRWKGVPIFLRSGKKLARRVAEIAVVFKSVPHSIIPGLTPEDLAANVLTFRIQPDEGISLTLEAKKPGPKLCLGSLTMDVHYREIFGADPPEAYHRLLLDAMLGDQTLFIRDDAVRDTWAFFDPLLQEDDAAPGLYPAGCWGPEEADKLMGDERSWRRPES
ncbi:MAG: glucose-6-phosphate dehydrogenase [Elusimicrobiota bacterium]